MTQLAWLWSAAAVVLAAAAACAHTALASEVVGCGGFVELSPHLQAAAGDNQPDLSDVQVVLVTKEGHVKYTTECAPNGYYFLPVYDAGAFDIKLRGRNGWFSRPDAVSINTVEGGECNGGKDINFELTGFLVTGRVVGDVAHCADCAPGPEGLRVSLTAPDGTEHATTTDSLGEFRFTDVAPGDYDLAAVHDEWAFRTNHVAVQVPVAPLEIATDLVVAGYPVSGVVLAGKGSQEGVGGVRLFVASDKVGRVEACGDVDVPADLQFSGQVVCHATSSASGRFTLPALPPGPYTLHPYHTSTPSSPLSLSLSPSSLPFSLAHASLSLPTPVVVVGFRIGGEVVGGEGEGVEGVAVSVDGSERTRTDAAGRFTLENMTSGTYTIAVSHPHLFFAPLTAHTLSPTSPSLPRFSPSRFHLCGTITIAKAPSSVPLLKHRDVVLTGRGEGQGAGSVSERTTTNAKGEFCFEAAPGVYYLTPTTTPEERGSGLVLHPHTLPVTISTAPILDAHFSQHTVSVSGTVCCPSTTSECGTGCLPSPVVLELWREAKGGEGVAMGRQEVGGAHGERFVFGEVAPGKYVLRMTDDAHCWRNREVEVVVGEEAVSGVTLHQSGFALPLTSQHRLSLAASHPSLSSPLELSVPAGASSQCLPAAGEWTLTPRACFKCAFESISFSTDSPTPVAFTPVTYRVHGTVHMPLSVGGGVSQVSVSIVDANKGEHAASVTATEREGVYAWEFQAKGGTEIEVLPHAVGDVLFYPRSQLVKVQSSESCTPELRAFKGRAGLVLEGSITPPIEGVQVHITTSEGEVVSSAVSDASGRYSVGKLYDDTDYAITASKDGYHFEPVEGVRGDFTATRLMMVRVEVVTDEGEPLEGVLLSLSGKGYRSNNPTGSDGTYTFNALPPADYYLKPVLKEFQFTPGSHSISGSQTSPTVTFTATRTAFSLHGSVRSVVGRPLQGVAVEAVEVTRREGEEGEREEAITDAAGKYRIRGLRPHTAYTVRPLASKQGDTLDRMSPPTVQLDMGGADRGVGDTAGEGDFVAFPKLPGHDLTGVVSNVSDEWLGKVSVVLATSSNSKAIATRVLDHSRFFSFPLLTPDAYTLTLKCDADSALWQFSEETLVVDVGNAHVHQPLRFVIQRKDDAMDDISSGSFFGLLLICGAAYAVFNYQDVMAMVKNWQSPPPARATNPKDDSFAPVLRAKAGRGKAKRK